MKILAYIAQDAKLKPSPFRWKVPSPRPEGEILREIGYQHIHTSIIRWRDGDGWQWRAVETDGIGLWYYEIIPGASGMVLKPRTLSAFEPADGYEYMVEGIIPLAPDSPDRLIKPEGWGIGDIAHWREKMSGATSAASALGRLGGQTKSPARAAASRANGMKGGRPKKKSEGE